jgi:nitrogenase subunit NifH
LAEAPSYGQTIFEYDPSCHGSEDYKQVAQLIHNQMQVKATESTENILATEHTEVTEVVKKAPMEIIEIPSAQPAQTPTANIEIKETQI